MAVMRWYDMGISLDLFDLAENQSFITHATATMSSASCRGWEGIFLAGDGR
jgi:hypothetical protein